MASYHILLIRSKPHRFHPHSKGGAHAGCEYGGGGHTSVCLLELPFLSISQGILSAIGHPFPKMIFNHGRKKRTWDYLEFEEEEDKQLADSMASLAYLVFVQGISIDQLPMVLR